MLRGVARRKIAGRCRKLFLHLAHGGRQRVLRQLSAEPTLELEACRGRHGPQTIGPGQARSLASTSRARPQLAHFGWYREGRLRPAERRARALDLLGSERRAMALLSAGFA